MASDFFREFGKALSKTAQDLGERVNSMYETQKLQSKIGDEEKAIEKLKMRIGGIVFEKYQENAEVDEELKSICEDIVSHLNQIDSLKEATAARNGQKICPGCKKSVDKAVSFCPYCGTPCPDPEPDMVEEDLFANEDEEAPAEESDGKPVDEEVPGETGEPAEEVSEPAEEVSEPTEEAAEETVDVKAATESEEKPVE